MRTFEQDFGALCQNQEANRITRRHLPMASCFDDKKRRFFVVVLIFELLWENHLFGPQFAIGRPLRRLRGVRRVHGTEMGIHLWKNSTFNGFRCCEPYYYSKANCVCLQQEGRQVPNDEIKSDVF